MENIFADPEKLLSLGPFLTSLENYVPQMLMKKVRAAKLTFQSGEFLRNDGEAEIQMMMDASNRNLRMYGSAKELATNLKILRDFPKSHHFFKSETHEPFHTLPKVLKVLRNTKGDQFITKTDVFVMLQTFIFKEFEFSTSIPATIAIFLKNHEYIHKGHYELIPFDQKLIDKLFQEVHRQYAFLENKDIDFPDLEDFLEFESTTAIPPDDLEKREAHLRCVKNAKQLMAAISIVMDKMKHVFRPWELQPKNGPNLQLVVPVRLFRDGPKQYFLSAELYHAMETIQKGKYVPTWTFNNSSIETTEFNFAVEQFGDLLDKAYIIDTSIERAKHATQPIPTLFGGFVIPASDALIQILREAIFAHKVFQKITPEEFEKFIIQLNTRLVLNTRAHFFYSTLALTDFKKIMETYFAPLETIAAKDVRNAKADGFTLQNLKNELVHLGLTTAFPNIADYAERAYDKVLERKKEKYMRNCDLFDAIEHCQFFCIFERFPMLKKFMHEQNGCYRYFTVDCDQCAADAALYEDKVKNKKETEENEEAEEELRKLNEQKLGKLKVYPYRGVRLEKSDDVNTTEIHWKIVCPDGLELYHNFSLYSIDELHDLTKSKKIKYFIFDKSELEFARQHKGQKETLSLREFSKHPRKTYYLRAIPLDHSEANKVVFMAEVIEIMPFISKDSSEFFKDFLEKLEMLDQNSTADEHATISLEEFNMFLEFSEIDRSLITIVPDPVYLVSRHQIIREPDFRTMNTIGPNGDVMMHVNQAIFHIWQTVTVRIDWVVNVCEEHEDCIHKFRERMVDIMKSYDEFKDTCFVSSESVNKKVAELQSSCTFKSMMNNTKNKGVYPSYLNRNFDELTRDNNFPITEDYFNNVYISEKKRAMENGRVPLKIWEARVIYITEINRTINNPEVASTFEMPTIEHLMPRITHALNFKTPVMEVFSNQHLMTLIANPHLVDSSFLEQTACLKGIKIKYSPEDPEESKGPEMSYTESKKEIDELSTMKDQLKTAKDQIKQWEDRKLDEKLSECQLEIETLKKKLEGHSNFASEIENLKRTVETVDDREQKLKEANRCLTDSIDEMKTNMSKLEAEKLRTTETNNELNERMIDLKGEVNNAKELLRTAESRLLNEVSQQRQEMERLKESMAVEKDQMSREISNLKDEKRKDAELIVKLEGELKKEQKQNERQKLESELRLEVEKTNHAVDQIQLEKEFSKLREAYSNLSDVCDKKDQIIRDLKHRLSKFPGGLP